MKFRQGFCEATVTAFKAALASIIGVLVLAAEIYVLVLGYSLLNEVFAGGPPEQNVAPMFGGNTTSGAPWYISLLIIGSPGFLALNLTVLWVRYQRAVYQKDKKPMSARRIRNETMIAGALFGVISQVGLQKLIGWLVGTPVMWELLLISVGATGLASMAYYEALRIFCVWRAKKGDDLCRVVYDWLSVKDKPEKKPNGGDTNDGPGELTRYMDAEDKTDPKT